MKNYLNTGTALLMVLLAYTTGCTDDRGKVVSPDDFAVNLADYASMAQDTVIVNANEKLTFQFPNGCPDQIIFYSGEAGKEYRFAKRGFYSATDGTTFESRLTISTAFNSFDGTIPTEDSLFTISGLGKSTVAEFVKAKKVGFKSLRSGSSTGATVKDQYVFTATSTPLNLFTGDVNFAIRAKSAEATKNLLSVVAAADTMLKNTEIRDYGYTRSGVTVVNKKTIIYPVISNVLASAAWAQYAPDSTFAPASTIKVANAFGYTWNMGEIGVSYAPAITGGTVNPNTHGVALAASYPVSVTVPVAPEQVSTGGIPSEAWLVSRVVNPCAVIPDAAVIVKKVDQSSVTYYQYIYKEKGIYRATITGMNVGTDGVARVAREFIVLVK